MSKSKSTSTITEKQGTGTHHMG